MKIKVEKKFRDKNTGVLYEIGEVIDVTDDRGAELLGDTRKLVSEVTGETAKPKKTATKTKTAAKPKTRKASK